MTNAKLPNNVSGKLLYASLSQSRMQKCGVAISSLHPLANLNIISFIFATQPCQEQHTTVLEPMQQGTLIIIIMGTVLSNRIAVVLPCGHLYKADLKCTSICSLTERQCSTAW